MIRSENVLLRQTLWLMGFGCLAHTSPDSGLAAFVRHHGIAGLIDTPRLRAMAAHTATALAQEQRRITLRALQLGAALTRLSRALDEQQLRPVALKGPALALQAHGRLSARGGVDLDILLPEQHWPKALEVLARQGYHPAPGQTLPLPAGTHELVLLHAQGQPRVELHRRLLRRKHLLADAATPASTLDLQGTPVNCLAPDQALPYLIAHANQHCFRRLIWLVDIHALLTHPGLDMEQAARQFRRNGTCAMLDACLSVLATLFATPVPAALEQVRRPCRSSRAMAALALQAIEQCWSDEQIAAHLGPMRRVALDVTLQDGLRQRLGALCDWLSPTGKDNHSATLPAPLAFLYPVVRLYRVLVRP
ncbi:nucleotidyltransferase family protein [Pseudomonas silvicola]|nr:nucleotidyltransferase family protein [Pseudomonas silvicola]